MSVALPHLLATAKADPGRLAVVWNNQELTYPAFVLRIAAVRNRMARLGLKPGRTAAVMIAHLVQAWLATLALQSLGLNTIIVRSPEELDALDLPDLDYVVTHASEPPGSPVPGWAARLQPIVIQPLSPEELHLDIDQVALPAGGNHILSTSGTTGSYKRMLFGPGKQAARAAAYHRLLGQDAKTVAYFGGLGLWTGSGFNGPLSVWTAGGAVVLDQRAERHLSFRERQLTHATLLPPELQTILSAPDGELPFNPGLRLLVIGSALPWRLAQEAMTRLTPQVYAGLGSTEIGVLATAKVSGPGDQLVYSVEPSREVQVVNENGEILPAGAVGLLRIRLQPEDLDSYMHDETATRAHFSDGFFYPGDLASIDSDGRLRLHGRANDVVNLGGRKIASLPIEQAIQNRLAAKGVCLLSETGPDVEDALHIVLEMDRPLTEADQKLLQSVAPDWKPRVHVVDSLPRNDMGKINRIELRRSLKAGDFAPA